MMELHSNIIKLGSGGQIVLTYLTNISKYILKTKQTADSWQRAKIVILFKKGGPKDTKNYRPVSAAKYSQDSCKLDSKEHWMKTSQESK